MLRHQHHFAAMGSPCEIQLYAGDEQLAWQLIAEAVAEVQRLEARYSRYRPDSLLSDINRVASAGGEICVDTETAALLNFAAISHRESGGRFDISAGVLARAWQLSSGTAPAQAAIDALLPLVGWHKIDWQPPRLRFPTPGMQLDLGGIVKEYAVDRLAALLMAAGIHSGIVNLGGDIRVLGPQPDGTSWQVGIRDPRQRDAVLLTVPMSGGAMASSGDYERCLVIDGVRYGHILRPDTGWPVHGLAAVSVIADLCVLAGSASTLAMLKESDGPAWLLETGLRHLWVDVDGHCGGSLLGER
ncbi:FAD:protein FMN transferase [Chitinimonas sp.]|uniref:FAD:protein FMN transferase n=1 Tax=Chitinimonas sp. TaxID=1934313 RepID=UPI0035AF9778